MWRKPIIWIPLALIAAIGITAVEWSPKAQAQTALRGPRAVVWKDFLGVNAQFQYVDPSIYEKQMQRLDDLGLNWVRLTTHWAFLEPKQAEYNVAALDGAMSAMARHKYNILAYMVGSAPFATSAPSGASNTDQYPPADFNIFAERMAMLAKRYPQVGTWQVWNEPNILWRPKEDPVAYGKLLFTTAAAIRAAVPGKAVATAGMAYYSQMISTPGLMLSDLLDQGLASQNLVVAYHPYSEYPEGDDISAQDFLTRANYLNSVLHAKGVQQVWATEWGWSSYAGPVEMQRLIGTDGQADYTLRRLALMSAMDFQRIFLFNLADLDARASPRDQYYGLLDLDGNPKPVYNALQNFLKVSGPRLEPADGPALSGAPDDLFSVAWTRNDGTHLWLFWSASGTSVTLPGVTTAALFNPLTGSRSDLANEKGINVPVKSSLQMLVW
ncbi:MAG: cellulase family glycosylhydrolase [Pseudomonas sp.]|nr:cellulase family glycosylhydrolase [Pseudomonas sp.]